MSRIGFSLHAVLRYLERVWGINEKELSEAILPKRYRRAAEGLGVKSIDIPDRDGVYSHTVKIRENSVATIYIKPGMVGKRLKSIEEKNSHEQH